MLLADYAGNGKACDYTGRGRDIISHRKITGLDATLFLADCGIVMSPPADTRCSRIGTSFSSPANRKPACRAAKHTGERCTQEYAHIKWNVIT